MEDYQVGKVEEWQSFHQAEGLEEKNLPRGYPTGNLGHRLNH